MKSCSSRGSLTCLTPTPTSADPPSMLRPNTSTTHNSPPSSGFSSNPASHMAPIDLGERLIRQRTATRPDEGSQPSNLSCSSRTNKPSRKRCCPIVEPTGPEKLPDCTPDTRSGSGCSSRAPQRMSGWDGQFEVRVVEAVRRFGRLLGAPCGEVVRQPNRAIELTAVEIVPEHRVESAIPAWSPCRRARACRIRRDGCRSSRRAWNRSQGRS